MEYYVSNYIKTAKNDDEAIRLCLEDSKNEPERVIVFDNPDYMISQAILLPSNITVILDGCHIKQADFTFDNVFRGDNIVCNPDNPMSVPLACPPIQNIKIWGRNGARISGPDKNRVGYHPVLEEEQEMTGDFWGWRTFTILLSNCTGFEISGIKLDQSRCWTITLDLCQNGSVHDLEIETNVKNGDGIDLRAGCRQIRIENLTGTTSDDSIACTALGMAEKTEYPIGNYLYPLEPSCCLENKDRDICDIQIRNVRTGGCHHAVICLAADGCRVHDILIDGVQEVGNGNREATVKLYTGYGAKYGKADLSRITVQNVSSRYAEHAVYCNTSVEDCILKNIQLEKIQLDAPEGFSLIDGIEAEDIQKMLKQLGISSSNCVTVHTSLKSIGKICGGAETMLNAFCEYLQEGMLVVPTHTWANVNAETPEFNIRTTKPCIGAFPSLCAKVAIDHENAVRSLHPTHSAAIFGKKAKVYADGEIQVRSRTPRNGVWGRLYDQNAKVVMIGVGLESNTYLHAVDEEVNDLPEDEAFYFDACLVDMNGKKHKISHMNKMAYWTSNLFPKLEPYFFEHGAVSYSRLGNAKVICFDVVKGHDLLVELCKRAENAKRFESIVAAVK